MAQDYTATDYHSFKDPKVGAKDYHQHLSDNIQDLDERVVKRGALADRPSASSSGRIFVTTGDPQTFYLDDGNSWLAIAGKDLGSQNFQAGEVQVDDGSASDPSITFKNDTNTGIYRSGADDLRITQAGGDILRLDGAVRSFGDMYLDGNRLRQVGGTTDASSGAIRLANGTGIFARNAADDGNITLVKTDTADDVEIGGGHRNIKLVSGDTGAVNVDGGHFRNVGGQTDANSGAIRLANGTGIFARNAADDGDVTLVRVTGSDDVYIGENADNVDVFPSFRFGINGASLQEVGGTTDASVGAIRMANGAQIVARNAGDSGDVGMMLVDSNDNLVLASNRESADIDVAGSSITEVGGTTDAATGAIRLANGSEINWRSSEDDANFGIAGTASEDIEVSDSTGSVVARFSDGGKVDIPNGNLVGGVGTFLWKGGKFTMRATANNQVRFEDMGANATLTIAQDGTVKLQQGNLEDDQGNTVWDYTNQWVPEAALEHNTVTVAGNAVSLGNSTTIASTDLSDSVNIAHVNDSESVTSEWLFEAGLGLNDDDEIQFGTGDDYAIKHNSTGDTLDIVHDPTGTPETLLEIDDNTSDPLFKFANAAEIRWPSGAGRLGSAGSVRVDIDNDNNSTSNWFNVTRHGGSTDLFNVSEDGTTDVEIGPLQVGNDTIASGVSATGSVSLSSGSATVDTGVGSGTTATFMVAVGPTTDDAEVAASIEAASGGNYTVHFDEINTSVGNPTVEYDIIRVR